MSFRRALLVLFLLPLVAAAEPAKEVPKYNLVLIAVDGLRADHMSLYGYARDTTPNLDRRAKSAVVFDRAFTQASWTLPSFATIFTSRYPEDHRVLTPGRSAPPSFLFLAQVLRDAGMRTAGFAGGYFLNPIFGLSRGFEVYRIGGNSTWRFFRETAPQASQWIRENKDRRFFVFVHGNDVHPPFDIPEQGEHVRHYYDADYHGPVDEELIDYDFVYWYNLGAGGEPLPPLGVVPPSDYLAQVRALRSSPRDLEHLVAHHDERIREADRRIEQIFETLRETGLERDTVVILIADHGLELGEKGKLATGFHATAYNSVLRVPLILWAPGLAHRRVEAPVQLVDLAPTALELLGVRQPPEFKGKSFLPLARGLSDPPGSTRYAFSVSSVVTDPNDTISLFAVQDARWKLIYAVHLRQTFLYDLQADPQETRDVGAKYPDEGARLFRVLSQHLGQAPPLSGPAPR